MRLALADVKKSVVRRDGEAYLVPHLLRRGDLQGELAALIALYEEHLGQPRARFLHDRPAEIVGDYRLARGLLTALADWYIWEPPAWPGPARAEEANALRDAGIHSPSQLRLALYDAVQREMGGYLPRAARERFLDAFVERLSIGRDTLDALLELDADACATLRRLAAAPPTPAVLATRYNWRAVEAVLAAAASVTWTLPPAFAAARGLTLGTLLKQVCFLARRMGVYYDAEYAVAPDRASGQPLARVAERAALYDTSAEGPGMDERRGPINVVLYGPEEVFGGPAHYGDRLARLCRSILGLSRLDGAGMRVATGAVGLRGEAIVYLRSRPFRFTLDERLLHLVLPESEDQAAEPAPGQATFDSEVERQFNEEFAALERDQATHGWHIEREPEPVLADSTIFIPDFALTRGARRIYLEVAGYWSPGYRERKSRKLRALASRIDLLVAAPQDARDAFAALDGVVPCVWYAQRPTARQLLAALATHWDDFAERRAAVTHAAVLADVARRGVVPLDDLGSALNVFDRTELACVVADTVAQARLTGVPETVLVDGLGLVSSGWFAAVGATITQTVLERGGSVPLRDLADLLSREVPALRVARDREAAVEALVRASGYLVDRDDLFHPLVRVLGGEQQAAAPDAHHGEQRPRKNAQPRRARRRSQSDGSGGIHADPIPWDDVPD